MHRHRAMCTGVCAPYRHHGMNICSPYQMYDPLPLPDIPTCAPTCCYDYPYRSGFPCADYSHCDYLPRPPPRPPHVHTQVRNNVCYYLDDPYETYDDEYGNGYQLSRSKVQLVDVSPKHKHRRNNMVLSTFQPREKHSPERVIVPRSTLRATGAQAYERQRRMKLMPLYHSAQPQYTVPHQRRSMPREIVPLATVANPNRQTIRVRSLSPM